MVRKRGSSQLNVPAHEGGQKREDELLLTLRNSRSKWADVHKNFPHRSLHALKVRYRSLSTGSEEPPPKLGVPGQSLAYNWRTYFNKDANESKDKGRDTRRLVSSVAAKDEVKTESSPAPPMTKKRALVQALVADEQRLLAESRKQIPVPLYPGFSLLSAQAVTKSNHPIGQYTTEAIGAHASGNAYASQQQHRSHYHQYPQPFAQHQQQQQQYHHVHVHHNVHQLEHHFPYEQHTQQQHMQKTAEEPDFGFTDTINSLLHSAKANPDVRLEELEDFENSLQHLLEDDETHQKYSGKKNN